MCGTDPDERVSIEVHAERKIAHFEVIKCFSSRTVEMKEDSYFFRDHYLFVPLVIEICLSVE